MAGSGGLPTLSRMADSLTILHLADSHIGADLPRRRRGGRRRRGDDLVDSYHTALGRAGEFDVGLIIHAGDVFDSPRPGAEALHAATGRSPSSRSSMHSHASPASSPTRASEAQWTREPRHSCRWPSSYQGSEATHHRASPLVSFQPAIHSTAGQYRQQEPGFALSPCRPSPGSRMKWARRRIAGSGCVR